MPVHKSCRSLFRRCNICGAGVLGITNKPDLVISDDQARSKVRLEYLAFMRRETRLRLRTALHQKLAEIGIMTVDLHPQTQVPSYVYMDGLSADYIKQCEAWIAEELDKLYTEKMPRLAEIHYTRFCHPTPAE